MSWVALSCLKNDRASEWALQLDHIVPRATLHLLFGSGITVLAYDIFVHAVFTRLIFITFCLERPTAFTGLSLKFSISLGGYESESGMPHTCDALWDFRLPLAAAIVNGGYAPSCPIGGAYIEFCSYGDGGGPG